MSGRDDVLGLWEQQAGDAHALIARMHEDALAAIRSRYEGYYTSILLVPPTPQCPPRHSPARGRHAGNPRRTRAEANGDAHYSTPPDVDRHSAQRYQ